MVFRLRSALYAKCSLFNSLPAVTEFDTTGGSKTCHCDSRRHFAGAGNPEDPKPGSGEHHYPKPLKLDTELLIDEY
jgi:hypothetical protein